MSEYNVGKMGWMRDLPDARDYHQITPEVNDAIFPALAKLAPVPEPLPSKVDLRKWASPIESQALSDCTAHAGTGLLEYYGRKAERNYSEFSRLFLYKMTRNLMGLQGDNGATLRDTMKAMAKFGVPPEDYWKYWPPMFDVYPADWVVEKAKQYQVLVYYRLDPPGQPTSRTVTQVKRFLAAELPSMLGFTVYSSIPQIGERRSRIPFYYRGDKILGAHAVMLIGYDDDCVIGPNCGAFLIANSWGVDWGDLGYGWLPYRYILEGQACDIWSMILAETPKGAQAT